MKPAHCPPLKTFPLNMAVTKIVTVSDWDRITPSKVSQPQSSGSPEAVGHRATL
jgi:hypothetical protein